MGTQNGHGVPFQESLSLGKRKTKKWIKKGEKKINNNNNISVGTKKKKKKKKKIDMNQQETRLWWSVWSQAMSQKLFCFCYYYCIPKMVCMCYYFACIDLYTVDLYVQGCFVSIIRVILSQLQQNNQASMKSLKSERLWVIRNKTPFSFQGKNHKIT